MRTDAASLGTRIPSDSRKLGSRLDGKGRSSGLAPGQGMMPGAVALASFAQPLITRGKHPWEPRAIIR